MRDAREMNDEADFVAAFCPIELLGRRRTHDLENFDMNRFLLKLARLLVYHIRNEHEKFAFGTFTI